MRQSFPWKWLPPLVGLACGVLAGGVRAEDPPALDVLAEVHDLPPRSGGPAPMRGEAVHEVIRSPAVARVTEPVEKAPPSPIIERPGVHPPGPNYQWIEGYWEWDRSLKDFVWVTGTWHVPPAGSFWVNSHWRRDEKGWTRVSGFWSGRQGQRVDWRKSGPPADRPEDVAGPAPGPDYFYVAGEYIPDGDGVAWKPGFWSRSHPGWAWKPARWVREPSGWTFQEGRWNRDTTAEGRREPPARIASPIRAATIVSTPAEAGTPPRDDSDSDATYAEAPPLILDAGPPLTVPALPPDEESPRSEAEANPIGSTSPPPLTSPGGLYDRGYSEGSPGDPGEYPSLLAPTRPEVDAESGLTTATGDTTFPQPPPLEAGNPAVRAEGLPQFVPGYARPDAGYAPRVYRRSGPYIYRRGYNGGPLRNVVPRARGLLNRVLPR